MNKLPIEVLKDNRFRITKDMLVSNAQFIYNVVDSLKYVRLVEHGDFVSGDYYTSTEYRIKDGSGGDTIWSEIPKDIYYWYLVFPKIDRECVYKNDNTSSSQNRTYGYFWKDYIWNNPHPSFDYSNVDTTMVYLAPYKAWVPGIYKGGSPEEHRWTTLQRFGELIQEPDVLWDRRATYYPFNRAYQESNYALNVIGNFVSFL